LTIDLFNCATRGRASLDDGEIFMAPDIRREQLDLSGLASIISEVANGFALRPFTPPSSTHPLDASFSTQGFF
jgi:hypothetical protein